MTNLIEKIQEWLAMYGFKVIGALAILVIGWLVARLVRRIVRAVMTKGKAEPILISFVASMTYGGPDGLRNHRGAE